eukprot:Protomagalhaensia_sp_Gyna_25__4279@NODE_38_length_6740_cov_65_576929_g27_i0_p3_GENE_NODE_38_length_6740_cov_65_576929_g27_i0NODE_38_length_6740_cov_65_576929_g27_i0_p3_ORF_typecomplete_len370_score48_66zfRING_2/PF13639_6/2_3e09zfC3HC4_3/PF13920_6/3_3e08zfC3HC4_3/PF13920_6/2_4e03zfC3HC4_2/PF13923_6/2_5e07zfC3HC4_2/PF13923_6/6_3e03zfRING_5/PF14634_6/3e07zfRING_5/PF14634_6/8_1e03zfRING_5/PF14634_6/1_4e03zfrbx1/PF12678_7/1_2e05zfC3HC4/PF00097_25/2_6e05zfC3HC4/PF00097_25/4_9e03zfRING_4/PF14570_6/2_7e
MTKRRRGAQNPPRRQNNNDEPPDSVLQPRRRPRFNQPPSLAQDLVSLSTSCDRESENDSPSIHPSITAEDASSSVRLTRLRQVIDNPSPSSSSSCFIEGSPDAPSKENNQPTSGVSEGGLVMEQIREKLKHRASLLGADLEDIEILNEDAEECPVCTEAYDLEEHSKAHPSECRHWFCISCLERWTRQSNECPLCKTAYSAIQKLEPTGEVVSIPAALLKESESSESDSSEEGVEAELEEDDEGVEEEAEYHVAGSTFDGTPQRHQLPSRRRNRCPQGCGTGPVSRGCRRCLQREHYNCRCEAERYRPYCRLCFHRRDRTRGPSNMSVGETLAALVLLNMRLRGEIPEPNGRSDQRPPAPVRRTGRQRR